jgi:membrane protease YdiL (CAAX protease family)
MNPASPLPQSFDERLSRVRLRSLFLPLVPLILWDLLSERLGVPRDVYRIVNGLLACSLLFAWWLWKAAPPQYSMQATMWRPPNLAGWGVVSLVVFAESCFIVISLLFPHRSEIVAAFSSGSAYSYTLLKERPEFLKILSPVVLAPITEELVFRGAVFRKWRVRWSPSKGVLLSSAIFALLHKGLLGAFLGGLTYALVYTRTRSILASIVAHALHNAVLRVVLALNYLWGGPEVIKLINLRSPWEYGTLALVLLLGVGLWVGFAVKSWRTLGDPLPPDSRQPAPAASPSRLPEPARVEGGSTLTR